MDEPQPLPNLDQQLTRAANRQMRLRLLIVLPLMFAFGFALVPLYKKICEVSGINALTNKMDYLSTIENTQVDLSRKITIEFDANTQGPFQFRPERRSMEIYPGELAQVVYEVSNTQAEQVDAQAIPSYAPMQAGAYFSKLVCFCFQQQTLKAKEKRQMPVAFIIDPKLPKDIHTITLSYTFFKVR